MTQAYNQDDPGDDAFFSSGMWMYGRYGDQKQQGEEAMFGKRRQARRHKVIALQYFQVQALGRLVARAMTDFAAPSDLRDETGLPVMIIDHNHISAVSKQVSAQAESILRQPVHGFFSHFVTENEHSHKSRENLVLMFNPPLTYNGITISFHFDREALPADVSARDEHHGTA